MEITVKMTAEEFAEFMEFRKDHDVNGKRVKSLRDDLVLFCKKLLWAVTPNDKKPGTYKITDQDHMDDLVLMADHYKE